MKELTGGEKMDAAAVLEYFAPLQTWLKQQNEGKSCGWQASTDGGRAGARGEPAEAGGTAEGLTVGFDGRKGRRKPAFSLAASRRPSALDPVRSCGRGVGLAGLLPFQEHQFGLRVGLDAMMQRLAALDAGVGQPQRALDLFRQADVDQAFKQRRRIGAMFEPLVDAFEHIQQRQFFQTYRVHLGTPKQFAHHHAMARITAVTCGILSR